MASYTSKEEFDSTYKTLFETFDTGLTKSVAWRKWQLKQLYWMLEDNKDAIVEALNQDFRRHDFETFFLDICGVKAEVLEFISKVDEWAAGHAPVGAGFMVEKLLNAWIRKEPLGVCLIISSWNAPWSTTFNPAAAAIAAGNCVLLKPSEHATATQHVMARLVPRYMDPRAVRIATGSVEETTYILTHKFNHIFYTGGGQVGRIIALAAARHLTPTVLELGGQSPAIVTATADLDLAARRIAAMKLLNSGQVCLTVNHVLVDPSVHDAFVRKITDHVKNVMLRDDGDDNNDNYNPSSSSSSSTKTINTLARIVSPSHYDRIHDLLSRTRGTVVYGGTDKCDRSQRFIHPTIVTDIDLPSFPSSSSSEKVEVDPLMSTELFSPILPIIPCSLPSAIRSLSPSSSSNLLSNPLALYIFSTSQPEISRILSSTSSGGVTVNETSLHPFLPGTPFGGVGDSGHGAYTGKYGFDAFSHDRPVVDVRYRWVGRLVEFPSAPFPDRGWVGRNLDKDSGKKNLGFRRGEGMEDQEERGGRGGMTFLSFLVRFGVLGAVLAAVVDLKMGGGRTFSAAEWLRRVVFSDEGGWWQGIISSISGSRSFSTFSGWVGF